MRMLFAFVSVGALMASAVHAAMPKVIFGNKGLDAPLAAGEMHTVVGPLVQLQTVEGTMLSLQRGARFQIDETGQLTLVEGNLRVGPAGMADVVVKLPQGDLTVAPLTAATVTAGMEESTGRVYQGQLTALERVFGNGEGFVLAMNGVRGTFMPAAAEAPAVDGVPEDLGEIMPAAGEETAAQTPPEVKEAPVLVVGRMSVPTAESNSEEVVVSPVEEPVVETPPVVEEPATEVAPVTETPVFEEPVVEIPAEEPVVNEPPAFEEPVVEIPNEEPVAELPATVVTQGGLLAAWSGETADIPAPNGKALGRGGTFRMERFGGGPLGLIEAETLTLSRYSSRLLRGSAGAVDVFSDGSVAGLGRWVGGEMVAVKTGNELVNVGLGKGSLHYIWGERATEVPGSGRISYRLLAATQPTYTGSVGNTMEGAGVFDGSLEVDFAPNRSGRAGKYHLNGTVTMPQVEMQADGSEMTKNVVYGLATPTEGVGFFPDYFDKNTSALQVMADAGAVACPGGCAGTVNLAGFGQGMKDIGAVYEINPGAAVGVAGAALFGKE